MEMLKRQIWHGNVRELRNSIERAMNFTTGNVIHEEDFQLDGGQEALNIKLPDLSMVSGERLIDAARDDAEKEVIIKVLKHFGNNKSKAAEYLNIARPSLYRKMKRLGIE